jgi:hypothetical protein
MSKRNVLLAVAGLLIAAGSAYGQSIAAVTVPFSFFAGSHNLPAGDYTIKLNHEKGTMTLHSNGRSGNITVVMLASTVPQTSGKSYALFNRYGSQYFLTQVWREGAGQTLTPGKLERELASQRTTPALAREEARLSLR